MTKTRKVESRLFSRITGQLIHNGYCFSNKTIYATFFDGLEFFSESLFWGPHTLIEINLSPGGQVLQEITN